MPLESGSRVGPYEIVSAIGPEGGGEIYKATDTEQHRDVAIKKLPERVSEGSDAKARLQREVKALSGLNHPHIGTPLEIRQEADAQYLVSEFIDGETLSRRLARGRLPLEEALQITIAIAEALHEAHGAGVVHRNLKPENVMLPSAGSGQARSAGPPTVKLVDFGLPHVSEEKPAGATVGFSAQLKPKVTLPDLPDDVVRYLAPEQVEGRAADARSDIFALGTMLYEMVTGEKAFEGRNRAMLIAAIGSLDPYPLSKTQPDSPPALDHVASRCLAKDPDDRWQTAHDLLIQLRWVAEGGGVRLAALRAARKRERRLLAIVAGALFVLTVGASQAFVYWNAPKGAETFQFRVPVAGLSTSDIAMSPDGKLLALVAKPNTQESSALFVRPTGAAEFRKLVGTDDAAQPFWSPDSGSIGFFAGGHVKRVDASGGAPKDLGEAPGFTGGAWATGGVILFGSARGLYRVSAEGGKPEQATVVEKPETGHFWPAFLPDGQHYLYLAWSADAGRRAVFSGALGSKDKAKLMAAESNARYAPSTSSGQAGYVVFHRDATLFAQPFDAKRLATTGDPVHIADQVEFSPTTGRASFDVSQQGGLVYFQGAGRGGPAGRGNMAANFQWTWKDPTGRDLEPVGDTGMFGDMDVSPDGKLVAVTQPDATAAGADIYVIDWQRGVSSRLTLDPGDDVNPVWSRPSGDQIAFTTWRKGNADIYIKNANGNGPETPLLDTPNNELIEAWSNDGRYIAYKQGPEGAEDIWILPMFGDKKPFPFVQGAFHKDEPQFSSDGKWLAYTSDESGGVYQVWVVSFPGKDQRLQVSKDGGGQPRWREDGRKLFFRSLDGSASAVDVTPGPKLTAGVPQVLFGGGPMSGATSATPTRHQWAVAPNGQRFLVRGAIRSAARAGRLSVPQLVATVNTTRGAQAAPVAPGQAFVSSGLTVVRNWPARVGK